MRELQGAGRHGEVNGSLTQLTAVMQPYISCKIKQIVYIDLGS